MSQNNKREPSQSDGGGEAKRLKSALEALHNIADEYICPITRQLPLKPVTAKDGYTYEESAIREHIERQGNNLKSPVTMSRMGPELITATPVRNTIEKLVKSEALGGDKAKHWEKRVEDEKEVLSLMEKAENGDSGAMYEMGTIFDEGLCGEKKDDAKAFEWYKQASDNKYPPGMGAAGQWLVLGLGTTKNVSEGLILVALAAERGSASAAYILGAWYARGLHGMRTDDDLAKEWLQKAISDRIEFAWDIDEDDKKDARDALFYDFADNSE